MKKSILITFFTMIWVGIYCQTVDYPGAVGNFAPTCNYATGRTASIDTWVNHWIGTGTYAGAISWFLNCSSGVSAHFVIRASDGQITQTVKVANTAWHCGATGYPLNNPRSIGIEHEATTSNPSNWNSLPMLTSSTNMACYFTGLYNIPRTRALPGIREHKEMPGTNTSCAGTIPWTTWMNMLNSSVNNGCSSSPSQILCNNDNPCSSQSLTINTNGICNNTNCSTVNANPPSPDIPYSGSTNCTSNYQPGRYDDDVWFTITPSSTNQITIRVTPTSNTGNFDPAVGLYQGTCSSLSQIGCADTYGVGATENLIFTPNSGTTYYIRVFSYGIGSTYSGDFQICTFSSTCTPPSAPSANSANNVSQTGFQANWGSVSGATSYRLDVSTSSSFSSFVSGYNDLNVGNVTSYNVSGLSGNTFYYYRVRAFNNCVSSNSNTITQATSSSSPTDPCTSITTISACGSGNTQTFTSGGSGAWFTSTANDCGYNSPGIEKIFSFTAPLTGNYSIQVTAASGFVDYLWKSGSCTSSGWTCIEDIISAGQYGNMYWTAGTTYFLLLDDENNITGTHTFYINCPSAPCNPPAQPGSISGNPSLCQGDSETYSVNQVTGATSYTWQFPSGWSGTSTTSSITLTSGSLGGTISVTADNSCGSSPQATIQVSVNQAPTVSVNPPNATICSGGNGVLLQASGTAQNYSWSPTTGLNTSSGQSVTANPATTTTYTVTANNGNCSATSQATVVVSNQPTASIYPGNPVLCSNGSLILSASSGISYSWTGPNGFNSSSQTVSISNTGLYSVTITDPGGCSGSATATVNVIQSPALTVNAGTNQVIAPSSTTTLGGNPTASGGTSPYTYAWTPAGSLDNAGIANPQATPTANTTYTLTVTDANGCTATSIVSVNISGSTNCQVTLNPSNMNIPADPGNHTITLTIDPGCPWTVIENCNWLTFTNTSGSGSATLTFTVTQNNLAIAKTCVVNVNGEIMTITQNPCMAPSADFTASQQAGIVPFSVTFYDNSSNSPTQWAWTFPGGSPSSSTLQTPTVTYNSEGIFDVTLKVTGACGYNTLTKSSYIGVLSTGIDNTVLSSGISVYPNPNKGTFTVRGEMSGSEIVYLNLFSALGQLVHSD